ncbi:hypothetical protein Nepgr_015447 [Nepenthes gracilis]|uniref:Coiled-coil domain-containing protein 16 n=1 Tax=Nepenthes gracilis TaxID=150966 RepID=A0AAD3XRA8_NEPGR|nr:hypothetical protein Nepgr_015447 [Nepenthes gracilis]
MDAAAKRKVLFRAKVKQLAQEKRIESPLVRYNEDGKPVCRVCNVVLKSDSIWPAHQASQKHHEAINNLKANASRQNHVKNAKPEPMKEMSEGKSEGSTVFHDGQLQPSTEFPNSLPSAILPVNFFDNNELKGQKSGSGASKSVDTGSSIKVELSSHVPILEQPETRRAIQEFPSLSSVEMRKTENQPAKNLARVDTAAAYSKTVQVQGPLPEGFFDNKEADLRARGIEPVKPDVEAEYKEFERSIQPDLQEVDNRFEEEEIDAAEIIEEEETVEQKTYWDRVEFMKRKRMELIAARSSKHGRDSEVAGKKPVQDELSSEDDSDENFAVDWRAQHL